MKQKYTMVFALFNLCFLLGFETLAQDFWQTTNGISGGRISTIAKISDNVLIAGSYQGGLFRSSDNGLNWTSISNQVDNYSVFVVKNKPSGVVFVGTSRSIYRSTDLGLNWTSIKNDLPNFNYVEDLTFDNAGNIYITYSDNGIFKSTNDGDNWTPINNGINSNPYLSKIEFTSNNVLIAADHYEGIYKSTDFGSSWTFSNTGFIVNAEPASITSNSSGQIFISNFGYGIYQSTNDGTSWNLITGDIDNLYIFDIATNSANDIFTATYNGVYKSTNSGTNWTKITAGIMATDINCITIENDNNIWVGTSSKGVAKSTDAGASWVFYSNGISSTVIKSLVNDNSGNLYAAADGRGFSKSSDNGATWNKLNILNEAFDNSITALDLLPAGGLIANATTDGIYITNDYLSWSPFNTGLLKTQIRTLTASNNYFFAGSSDGNIYRSPSSSASWVDITDTLSTNLIYDMGVKSTGELFIITDKGVYKSTNNGDTWLNVNNGIPVTYYFSVAFHPNGDVFIGGSGVYRSTDAGESWTVSTTGMTNSGGLSLAIHPNGSIFAGTFNSVYRSNDLGETWSLAGSGMDHIKVISLAFGASDVLFAGTEGLGIYKSSVPITSINKDELVLPDDFLLNQNYPNPFNPRTKISWQTPADNWQTLKIFDVLGNEVVTLVNEFKHAGSYEVNFDGSNLSSGVYFYTLSSGNNFYSRKMILLK